MTDTLRLVEDLVPLVELPAAQAVETLQNMFGEPKVEASLKRNSKEYAWAAAGVVIEETKGGTTISIICDDVNGFAAFKGRLSSSAEMPVDRKEVRESLGEPTAGRTNPRMSLNRIFGMRRQPPEWDRYDNPERVIHFEYDAGRKVKRVTLTAMPRQSS